MYYNITGYLTAISICIARQAYYNIIIFCFLSLLSFVSPSSIVQLLCIRRDFHTSSPFPPFDSFYVNLPLYLSLPSLFLHFHSSGANGRL